MSSKLGRQKSLGRSRLLGGALVTLMCVPAIGGPEGERVVSGSAKFKRQGNRTVIRASDNAIINYSGFDIASGERVRFIQPGSDARVLNRIRSDEPTRIDGMLRSNGNVYLVNRAGVLFGADAIINVGGLHAAAGNISNNDFLQGVDRFTLTGDLANMGRIEADHVLLAGRTVSNLGTIVANEGFVAMVAGDQVLVGERDGHMFAKIDSNRVEALDYAAHISGVTNAGAILATDGRVIVGAGDFYGIVTHTSTNIVTNDLTIESGEGGITRLAGNIDVSGAANGNETGGSARILGDRVAVDDAMIDATGALGGGEILIGGEFQGKGPIRNAKRTFVGANTTLDASAIDNGDGGRIIVWADELTGFAGNLIASGGALGGDGGFGEISGKHGLIFQGSVNLLAANGTQGTILFDPTNITILDGLVGPNDIELIDNEILGGDGGILDFIISEGALEALGGSVILQALNDITVNDLTDNELSFQAINGESIEITADFDANGLGTFSMAAGDTISTQGGDLNLTGAIIGLGASGVLTNGGDLNIVASGAVDLDTVATAGGSISALADSGALGIAAITLNGAITTGGGDARFAGADWVVAGTVDTGVGDLSFDLTTAQAVGLGVAGVVDLDAGELALLTTSGTFDVGVGHLGAASPTTVVVEDFDLTGASTITGDVGLLGSGAMTFSTNESTFSAGLSLNASDFDVQVGVTAGGVTFDRGAGGSFGLGDAVGDATLDAGELALINATTFAIDSSDVSAITADNVSIPNVGGTVTLNAGGAGGDVTFQTAASAFLGGLSVEANTGITIGVGVTSNGSTTFDANGNIIDVTGSVTIDSQGGLLNFLDAVTLDTGVSVSFVGTALQLADALTGDSGAENVVLDANGGSLTIVGAASGLNDFTMTDPGIVTLGGGVSAGGTITSSSLLTSPFDSSGGALVAGTIDLGGTQFTFGDLTSTVGGITVTNSAQAEFAGNVSAATSFAQDGAGAALFSGGAAQTVDAGTTIDIDGAASLADDTNVTFTGVGIDLAQALTGVDDESVTFDSGAGALGVDGAVSALGDLTIADAGITTFGGGIDLSGTLSTTNPLTGGFDGSGGAISADTIDLDGTTFTFASLTSTGGGVTITNTGQADFGGSVSAATSFAQDGAGAALFSGGAAQTVDAGTTIDIDGAASLADDTNVTFTGVGIDLAQTLTGVDDENVTFDSGAGTLGVGGAVSALNDLTITDAGATTFSAGIDLSGTLSTTNPLTVAFDSSGGAVSADSIDLGGTTFTFASLTSTGGGITITNSGQAEFGGNVSAATAFSQDGAGAALFSGGATQTVDAGTTINIDGAASLADNTNVTFTGVGIDLAQSLTGVDDENVTFDSGAGTLGVGGAVSALNDLTITDAGATTFGDSVTIAGTLSTTNPLTGLFTASGALDVGTIDLDGTALSFQAITTNVGGLTLTNSGMADFNGSVDLTGDMIQDGAGVVRIDGDITSNDNAITFSSLSVEIVGVDGGTGERLIDAGTGALTFSNALDTQGNDTVLEGDTINLDGGANSVESSAGAGELIIRPSTSATDIDLGLIPGGQEGSGLMLSRDDLEAIGSNFSLIQFGFVAGTHTVRMGLMDDSAGIDSRMMAATTILGTEIRLFDAIAGADDASFTLMGDVVIAEGETPSISTAAVDEFGINPDAGDIIFTGDVGGTTGGAAETLTLDAIRDIEFQGVVSGDGAGAQDATGLADLTFANADDVTFSDSLAISGLLSSSARMTGLFQISAAGSTVGQVDLTGAAFILNTLTTTTAGVAIDNSSVLSIIGDLTSMGAFMQTDALDTGSVTITADLDTTGGGALSGGDASFASAVTVGSDGPRLLNLGDGTLSVADRFEVSFASANPDPTVIITANGYDFTGDTGDGEVFTSTGGADATLIFRPADDTNSIDIGGGLDAPPADMVFGAGELALVDGSFASVRFGYETTGQHTMRIGDATGASAFANDTIFHAPDGDITVFGPVAGNGSLTFDTATATSVCDSITTDGGDVVFGDGLILCNDVTIDTQDNAGDDDTPGEIRVNGTIEGDGNGPWSLDLLAFEDDSANDAILGSSALILVTDTIGSVNPLNNLFMHGNDVALRGIGDVPNGDNGEGVLGTTELIAQDDLILRGGTYTTRTATYSAGDEIRPTEDTVFEVFNNGGTSTLTFSLVTEGMLGGDDDTFRGIRLENGASFTARTRGGDITIENGFARNGDGFADVVIDADFGNALSDTSGDVSVGDRIGFEGDLVLLSDGVTLVPALPVGSVDIRGGNVMIAGARSINAQSYVVATNGQLDLSGMFDALADGSSSITFDGDAILSADTSVSTAGGEDDNITFSGTIDGPFALDIMATKSDMTGTGEGNVDVAGLIGGAASLASLTVEGATVTLNGIGTLATPGVDGDTSVSALEDLILGGGVYNANTQEYMSDGEITVASISGDASFFSNGSDLTISTASGLGVPNVNIDPGSELFIDTRADRTDEASAGGDALIQANIRTTIGDGDGPVDLVSVVAGTGRALLAAIGGSNVTADRAIREVRVTADEIDLADTIVVDLLTFQQTTLDRDIVIGGDTDEVGQLDLLAEELANISDGTMLVTFGNANGTGTITFNEIEFFDPVVARVADDGPGRIVIAGPLTGNDDASFTFRGANTTTELFAGIETTGAQILFENNVIVAGEGIELATNGGDPDADPTIWIQGTLDSAAGESFDLTMDATVKGDEPVTSGSGNTRIDGQIGGADALSSLTIIGNDNTLNGSVGTADAAGVTGLLSMEAANVNTLNAPIFNAGGFALVTVEDTEAVDPHTALSLPDGDELLRFIVGADEFAVSGSDLRILDGIDVTIDSGSRVSIADGIGVELSDGSDADVRDTDIVVNVTSGRFALGGDVGERNGSLRPGTLTIDANAVELTGDVFLGIAGLAGGGDALVINADIVGNEGLSDLAIEVGNTLEGDEARSGNLVIDGGVGTVGRDGEGLFDATLADPIGEFTVELATETNITGEVAARRINFQRVGDATFRRVAQATERGLFFLGGSARFLRGIDAGSDDSVSSGNAVEITAPTVLIRDFLRTSEDNNVQILVSGTADDSGLTFSGRGGTPFEFDLGGDFTQAGAGVVRLGSAELDTRNHAATFAGTVLLTFGDAFRFVTEDLTLATGATINSADGMTHDLTFRGVGRQGDSLIDLNGRVGNTGGLSSLTFEGVQSHSVNLSSDLATDGSATFDAQTIVDGVARLDTVESALLLQSLDVDAPFTVDAGGAAVFSDVVDVNSEFTVIGRGTAFRRGRDGSTDVVFESSITSTSGDGELNIRVDGDPTDEIEFNNRTRAGQESALDSIAIVRLEGDVDGLATLRLNVVPNGDGELDQNGIPRETRARSNPFELDRVPIAASVVIGPSSAQSIADLSNPNDADANVSIDVGRFIVGFHEVLTANVNLAITANTITLGDTNVLGTLSLGPRSGGPDLVMNMLTRPRGSRFLLPNGDTVPNTEADLVVAAYRRNSEDVTNTDLDRFVSGDSLFFTGDLAEVNVRSLPGDPDARANVYRVALRDGVESIGGDFAIFDDALQIVLPLESIGRSDFFLLDLGFATEVNGLIGGANNQVQNAAVFATVAAAAESLVDVPDVVSVPTVDDDPLKDIAIDLRNLDGQELINALIGRALYVDLPLDPSRGSGSRIAADRMSYQQIDALRDQMAVVLPKGENEGYIRNMIEDAVFAFDDLNVGAPDEAPAQFVRYVYSAPEHEALVQALGEVEKFLDMLRTGVAGLTPGELARAEQALFQDNLTPARGISASTVRMLVEGPAGEGLEPAPSIDDNAGDGGAGDGA